MPPLTNPIGTFRVKFPGVMVPSADPNTLDDYEEGTFTPSLSFGGAAVGVTYTLQAASYTKIGNLVHVRGRVVLSSKGSSTGTARITGLPFACTNSSEAYSPGQVSPENLTFTGHLAVRMELGATTVLFTQVASGGSESALDNTAFTNTTNFMFSIICRVD